MNTLLRWAAKGFIQFMDQLPGTNFRTFVGVISSVLFVLTTLVGMILGKITAAHVTIIATIGSFLLVQMGLDVKQFIEKRRTFVHPPPAVATVTSPPDAPPAGKETAL